MEIHLSSCLLYWTKITFRFIAAFTFSYLTLILLSLSTLYLIIWYTFRNESMKNAISYIWFRRQFLKIRYQIFFHSVLIPYTFFIDQKIGKTLLNPIKNNDVIKWRYLMNNVIFCQELEWKITLFFIFRNTLIASKWR